MKRSPYPHYEWFPPSKCSQCANTFLKTSPSISFTRLWVCLHALSTKECLSVLRFKSKNAIKVTDTHTEWKGFDCSPSLHDVFCKCSIINRIEITLSRSVTGSKHISIAVRSICEVYCIGLQYNWSFEALSDSWRYLELRKRWWRARQSETVVTLHLPTCVGT